MNQNTKNNRTSSDLMDKMNIYIYIYKITKMNKFIKTLENDKLNIRINN